MREFSKLRSVLFVLIGLIFLSTFSFAIENYASTVRGSTNHAPNAVDDSATTSKNNHIRIYVLNNDSDEDGDAITIKSVDNPPHGTATISSDKTYIIYTPDTDFSGTDTFDYTITDGKLYSTDSATITVTVQAEPAPLKANAGADQVVAQDDNVTLDGIGSTSASSYSWDVNGHTYTGETPKVNSSDLNIGDNNITLTVTDNNGNTDSDIVNIHVMEVVNSADDLCYVNPPHYDGRFCMDMGMCKGGMGCKTTFTLKNQGDSNLTDAKAIYDESRLGGSWGDNCGVEPSGTCNTQSDIAVGIPMGGVSILSKATVFNIDDAIVPKTNGADVWSEAMMSMSCFNGSNFYGSYVKNGKLHRGKIYACNPTGTYSSKSGPIDARDTFRPLPNKNISTKVIDRAFKLRLSKTVEPTMSKPIARVDLAIYPKNSKDAISNHIVFDANDPQSYTRETSNINVTNISKDAVAGFKMCAIYKDGSYTLYDSSDCTGEVYNCDKTSEANHPIWHLCSSTDNLAVRPRNFDVNITNNATLIAGKKYNLKFKAVKNDGTTATNDYNESEGSSFTVDLNLTNPNSNCQYQTANNNPNVTFTNGVDDVNTSFNRVGEFTLTIKEPKCEDSFAKVDCNDQEIPTQWSKAEVVIEPKELNVTLLPDHFDIEGNYLDHHISNDANFTYLSDFEKSKAMASEYNLTITAKTADNNISSNYKAGCFAKSIDMNISYDILDANGNTITPSDISKVQYFIKSIDTDSNYQEVAINSDINYTVSDSNFIGDTNGTANFKLNINFNRSYNRAVNPFKMKLHTIKIKDANNTEGNATIDQNATFLYAKAKSSKYIYKTKDDSIDTPVSIEVYCDKYPASIKCSGVDVLDGKTEESNWFLSTSHKDSDGNVTLDNVDEHSTISTTDGTDANVKVSGTAPETKSIEFNSNSSDWLIYNKDSNSKPSPFYRVKFIYQTGNWSGYGKTGNIVGGDINNTIKSNSRTEW